MKLYKIKKSDIDKKGKGLYATRDIKEGEKIIDYIGKLITKKQTENSDKYDNSKPIYLFTVNKRYDLDGDFPWNTAGLINHSCENNCDYDGKGLKIWVKAIKDIKKGEELTCDYGFGYDKDYKQFPCKCKSNTNSNVPISRSLPSCKSTTSQRTNFPRSWKTQQTSGCVISRLLLLSDPIL